MKYSIAVIKYPSDEKSIKVFDELNNEIYYKNISSGIERWKYYDKNNNLLHSKSNISELWISYDEKNRITHMREVKADGTLIDESWTEYYDSLRISVTLPHNLDEGIFVFKEYDEINDKVIKYRNSKGFEQTFDYNLNGLCIKTEDSDGLVEKYDYDDKGHLIHTTNTNGYHYWYRYNEKEQIIYTEDNLGSSDTYEYDEQGRIKSITDANGEITTYTWYKEERDDFSEGFEDPCKE